MKKIFVFLLFFYSAPSLAHISHSPEIFHQLEHLIWILILAVVAFLVYISLKKVKQKHDSL
tara:strand:+ start:204 stop:386 length:183 start_codon:yes stop_codon:yes gene_type:complete